MRKTTLILTLLFIFAATPVLAKQNNGKANEHNKNIQQVQGIEVSPTIDISPTQITPTKTPCDPNEEYENHGKYVSCVAKTHPGGKVVSEAAKSDIGKNHHEDEDENEDDDDITPSPTVTITPTATPSVSPTISPTEEPTPTATPSGTTEGNALMEQIEELIQKLQDLLESLKNIAST